MVATALPVSTIKPLADRILVKVADAEEKTSGGIILPDAAKEKPQIGEVTEVGPGKRDDSGTYQVLDVAVGDRVLYSRYAGNEIKLGDSDYVLLREQDILATLS